MNNSQPPDNEGTKTVFTRLRYERLLRDWYGESAARGQMMNVLPKTHTISELLEQYCKRHLSGTRILIGEVRTEWEKLSGFTHLDKATPSHIEQGVLYVEVVHVAYQIALNSPKIKEAILCQLNKAVPGLNCTKLVFIPAGRRQPVRKISNGKEN